MLHPPFPNNYYSFFLVIVSIFMNLKGCASCKSGWAGAHPGPSLELLCGLLSSDGCRPLIETQLRSDVQEPLMLSSAGALSLPLVFSPRHIVPNICLGGLVSKVYQLTRVLKVLDDLRAVLTPCDLNSLSGSPVPGVCSWWPLHSGVCFGLSQGKIV